MLGSFQSAESDGLGVRGMYEGNRILRGVTAIRMVEQPFGYKVPEVKGRGIQSTVGKKSGRRGGGLKK
jgi:hypothetical protein